jgi:hypothetical protein
LEIETEASLSTEEIGGDNILVVRRVSEEIVHLTAIQKKPMLYMRIQRRRWCLKYFLPGRKEICIVMYYVANGCKSLLFYCHALRAPWCVKPALSRTA